MATVTGLTAERMAELEASTIVGGHIEGPDLILETRGGDEINAGYVAGPTGASGGAFTICTSDTRPSLSTGNAGEAIYETDTGLVRVWSGTRWVLQAKIICTSTTRPDMTEDDEGVKIYEIDSNLEYIWSGTEWISTVNNIFQICTSSTRPTLSVDDKGVLIYETNTELFRVWTGTRWKLQEKIICTSVNRPAGLVLADEGVKIYETDSNLEFVWNGTAWVPDVGAQGPAGIVVAIFTAAADYGYSLCDGDVLSRTGDGARLYAKWGTMFGIGNGTSTFNKPDLRGYGLMGAGAAIAGALGVKGGAATHTLTEAQMPTHTHGLTDPGHAHSMSSTSHTHSVTDPGHDHSVTDPGHNHSVNDPGHNHQVKTIKNVAPFGQIGMGDLFTYDIDSPAALTYLGYTGISIANRVAGVSVAAHATGVSIANASISAGTDAHTAGITAQGAGSSSPHNILDPYALCNWQVSL